MVQVNMTFFIVDLFRFIILSAIVDHVTAQNYSGTPYTYLGVGYNLLIGNPGTYSDPGFVLNKQILELTGKPLNVTEAEYQIREPCQLQEHKITLNTTEDYRREIMTAVQLSRHNTRLTEVAFTKNADFDAMRVYLQSNSISNLITTCKHGIGFLKTGESGNELFIGNVTKEFANDVCSLPVLMTKNNTNQYFRFLDRWGTSIVLRVDIGTRVVQTLGQFTTYKRLIDVSINKGSGDLYPISLALVPITYATNWILWERSVARWIDEGICTTDFSLQSNIARVTSNIETTVQQYENWTPVPISVPSPTTVSSLKTSTSKSVPYTISTKIYTSLTHLTTVYHPKVTWPLGTYGLIQSAQGCPDGGVTWHTGWRKFDTEDSRSQNAFSSGINTFIKGEFGSNDIKVYFCIKSRSRTSSFDRTWPRGNYCIFKYNSCPTGFSNGYIFWDDDDLFNKNDKDGTLPDGTYDQNTLIRFCCRNDGSYLNEIELPTNHPFLLVRYGPKCQQVRGMTSKNVRIYWDDEDLFNKDEVGGMHPYEDGGSANMRLYFCYYHAISGPNIIG